MAEVRIGLLIIIFFLMLTGCDGQSEGCEEALEFDKRVDEISFFFEADDTSETIVNW